ncbi:MAG: hypothetical protein H7Z12_13495 [Rhodospirillaceae bacterium]|nr:hypothetical protein [Rhodospirillales bacterium]
MAKNDHNRQDGGGSTIAFDQTALEEAINAVRSIGLTLVTMGMNAHPGDQVPIESVLWIGTHLSDAGESLNGQFHAYCATQG